MSAHEASNEKPTRRKWGKSDGKPVPFPAGAHFSANEAGHVQQFDTLQAALESTQFSDRSNWDIWADIQTGTSDGAGRYPSEQWYGIAGKVDGVKAAIRDGWPDGVARMREALNDLGATLTPRNIRRRRVWSDQGDSLDIHRVYSGQLDTAWQRTARRSVAGAQNVTIAAAINALIDVDARQLFWRGAAVLKLADMLTESGYNVQIDAVRQVHHAYKCGSGLLQRVTVKAATAPLELNGLAATVCLSGFFRYVLFSCMCIPARAERGKGKTLPYEAQPGEIAGVERCMSADAARDWINEQILKLEEPIAA